MRSYNRRGDPVARGAWARSRRQQRTRLSGIVDRLVAERVTLVNVGGRVLGEETVSHLHEATRGGPVQRRLLRCVSVLIHVSTLGRLSAVRHGYRCRSARRTRKLMRSSAWVRCSTAQCRSEKPLTSRMRGPVCSTRRHISSTSGPLTASKACAAGVAGAAAAGGADAIAVLARTETAADVT